MAAEDFESILSFILFEAVALKLELEKASRMHLQNQQGACFVV